MPHHTYLPFHRKRFALLVEDLSELLGVDHATISRVEAGDRSPNIHLALGLQVVFGEAPRDLFPDLYRAIEEAVINRAVDLDGRLVGKTGETVARQRALLLAMVTRSRPIPAQA